MSELRVDTIKKADGTGSLSVPAESGTVVTTASPSLGRRNLIINGAMQVAQRGTSSSNNGLATVDRFAADHGVVTKDQSQEALTSSDAPYALGFRNYMRLKNTGVSSATNAYARCLYKAEARDIANSGWNYASSSSAVTLSFWVRSSLAGTYYYTLRSNDGTAQNYGSSFTLTANTWTKVTKTVYGDSNITVNNDNGNGLELHIWAYLGTDYTSSSFVLDEWNVYSPSAQIPDYAQNWANTAGATFDLTGVQLEVGSVATPFEHRSYGEELALCQRYYYTIYPQISNSGIVSGQNFNSSAPMMTYILPTEMRANPSFSVSSPSDFRLVSSGAVLTPTGITLSGSAKSNGRMDVSGTSVTGGNGCFLQTGNTVARLSWDAEL